MLDVDARLERLRRDADATVFASVAVTPELRARVAAAVAADAAARPLSERHEPDDPWRVGTGGATRGSRSSPASQRSRRFWPSSSGREAPTPPSPRSR